MSSPPLPQSVGYAIVLGLGFAFAAFMNLITWVQAKFSRFSPNSASEFSAASRSLKTGIVVAGIVSSWTWTLTLLQSATQSYVMGVTGGYWYGVAGLLQIGIFSVIASTVKINANRATTFPEVAYIRFGTAGHLSFLWCGIVCNAIVSSCMLLGAGTVVAGLTGMNQYAASFLIPISVALYVATGGLRATFICDATHTFALLLILLGFSFYIFVGSEIVGSPDKLYDLLVKAAETSPVAGNFHGSYLTFRSRPGVIYAGQTIIAGFGLVSCDQGYWSRAIASNPATTARAYFLGGIAWFSIPFCCGTAMGLTARGLSVIPGFPVLSESEVGAGLASVRTVSYLMGTTGSVLMLLLIFLSITSALSAELIATSTLLSYDVYRHYFNPKATSQQVVAASRYFIFFWAVFSASLASVFYAIGINLGWLFYFLGVATASGVFPIALTFMWKDLSKAGAVCGSLGGMVLAFAVWLATAKLRTGSITIPHLGDLSVSFAGNITALVSGGIISIGVSLWRPAGFDWELTRSMAVLVESNDSAAEHQLTAAVVVRSDENEDSIQRRHKGATGLATRESESEVPDIPALEKAITEYAIAFSGVAFILVFLIPGALGGSPYVFSRTFFKGFVGVMFICILFAFYLVVILPIFESRRALMGIARALVGRNEQ